MAWATLIAMVFVPVLGHYVLTTGDYLMLILAWPVFELTTEAMLRRDLARGWVSVDPGQDPTEAGDVPVWFRGDLPAWRRPFLRWAVYRRLQAGDPIGPY